MLNIRYIQIVGDRGMRLAPLGNLHLHERSYFRHVYIEL